MGSLPTLLLLDAHQRIFCDDVHEDSPGFEVVQLPVPKRRILSQVYTYVDKHVIPLVTIIMPCSLKSSIKFPKCQ